LYAQEFASRDCCRDRFARGIRDSSGVAPASANWESVGGTSDESGFSSLTAINNDDVDHLGLAWSLDLPGEKRVLEATMRVPIKWTWAATTVGRRMSSIYLDAFDLNAQQHVLIEAVLLAVVHAEIRTIERTCGVRAADLFLEHRMLDALERIDRQRHRLGDAVQS
jgi:hypothetical protein